MVKVDFGNANQDVNFSEIQKYKFLGVDGDGAVVLYEKIPKFVNNENCKLSEEEKHKKGMWIYSGTANMQLINRSFKMPQEARKLFSIEAVFPRSRHVMCREI